MLRRDACSCVPRSLIATPLVLGAWTSASEGVVPTCTAQDMTSKHLITRDGYSLTCGRGSAVVKFKGITYEMKHSLCIVSVRGGRLYFGVQPGGKSPQNGLYLVMEPSRKGAVRVIDGGLNLASGLEAPILGKARATARLKRGTFTLFGHLGNGQTDSRRFTGSWNCSSTVRQ